ncbi:MAG: hypothetical protein V3575_02435, partial [Candidatus Absconditabacteria bacterium]
ARGSSAVGTSLPLGQRQGAKMKITSLNTDTQFLVNDIFYKIIDEISNFLGNVKIISLEELEFEKLNGKFVEITKEDKYGKYYNLYIPKNITKFQLLDYLVNLNNYLNVYTDEELSEIKGTIKTLLCKANKIDGKTLKVGINNKKTQKQLIENLDQTEIGKSHIKKAAKLLQNSKQINILDPKNKKEIINILETTEKFILKSFMIGLFRIGRKNTYENMTSFKEKTIEDRILKEESYNIEQIYLHQKIDVDKYIKEIENAKISGNVELLEKIQLEAANKICSTIAEYPYVNPKDLNNGYKPNFIIKKHYAQCVGFAYLCNIFFDKLGIKNKALIYEGHINLSVYIGNKSYICDPNRNSKLDIAEIVKGGFNEQKIIIQNGTSEGDNFAFEIETQEGIMLCIINNFETEVATKLNKLYKLEKIFNFIFNIKLETIKGLEEFINIIDCLNSKYHRVFYFLYKGATINDLDYKLGNKYLTLATLNGPNQDKYYLEKYKLLRLLNKGKTAKLYKFTYDIIKGKKEINKKYFGIEKEIVDCIIVSNYKKLVKILIKQEINENKK